VTGNGARHEEERSMMKRFAMIAGAALLAIASPAWAQGSGLSDAQIAHIAYTAGQLDIEAARQALERSRNGEVRAFAETMVRDHQAVNEQAVALLQRLGVTPQEHATSAALSSQATAERQRLAGLEEAAFDRAYAEREAAFHAAVNAALSGTLIPSAHNAELRALLEAGLSLFSAHQEHAEALARQLR
jgi:putative membrane protein